MVNMPPHTHQPETWRKYGGWRGHWTRSTKSVTIPVLSSVSAREGHEVRHVLERRSTWRPSSFFFQAVFESWRRWSVVIASWDPVLWWHPRLHRSHLHLRGYSYKKPLADRVSGHRPWKEHHFFKFNELVINSTVFCTVFGMTLNYARR